VSPPVASALVLRDRTNADPQQVLTVAIVRAAAIRTLSPLGAAFVVAWCATATAAHGFAVGTVGFGTSEGAGFRESGAGFAGSALPPGG
jgi:hypothetical protein